MPASRYLITAALYILKLKLCELERVSATRALVMVIQIACVHM